MKANTRKNLYLLLSIFALVFVSLACVASAPDSMEQLTQDITDAGGPSSMVAIPPEEPTPTAAPIESSCLTPAMYKSIMKDMYSWVPQNFTSQYDWDATSTYSSDPSTMFVFGYNESRGCITGVGAVVGVNWSTGDFNLAGEYLGSIGVLAEDMAVIEWVQNLMTQCINTSIDKEKHQSGQTWMFSCEDSGDSVVIAVAIHND